MIIEDLDHLEVVELENPTGGYSWVSNIDSYVNNLLSNYLPRFGSGGNYTPNSAPSNFSRSLDSGTNDVDVSINGGDSPGIRSFTTPDDNGLVQIGGSSSGGGRSFSSARSGDFEISSFF